MVTPTLRPSVSSRNSPATGSGISLPTRLLQRLVHRKTGLTLRTIVSMAGQVHGKGLLAARLEEGKHPARQAEGQSEPARGRHRGLSRSGTRPRRHTHPQQPDKPKRSEIEIESPACSIRRRRVGRFFSYGPAVSRAPSAWPARSCGAADWCRRPLSPPAPKPWVWQPRPCASSSCRRWRRQRQNAAPPIAPQANRPTMINSGRFIMIRLSRLSRVEGFGELAVQPEIAGTIPERRPRDAGNRRGGRVSCPPRPHFDFIGEQILGDDDVAFGTITSVTLVIRREPSRKRSAGR